MSDYIKELSYWGHPAKRWDQGELLVSHDL